METPISILTTFFIVFLIVPGVFFKRFYFSGEFTQQFGVGLFADRLISSIFWGVIVQLISSLIFSRFFGFDLLNIKNDLTESYSNLANNKLPDLEKLNPWMFLAYLILSIVVAVGLGKFLHAFVRLLKFDIYFKTLRFANHWNYYFRGEFNPTVNVENDEKEKWSSTYVDIVMDGGDQKPKMLQGFLYDYTISTKTGDLDSIILSNTKKFVKKEGSDIEGTTPFKGFLDIPGDYFIIPYSKIIDLNIRYNTLRVRNRIKPVMRLFLKAFSLSTLLVALIYPWFLGLSFLRTIAGILLFYMVWIFLDSLIYRLIGSNTVRNNDEPSVVVSIVAGTLLLLFCLHILRIQICYSCAWNWLLSMKVIK